MSVPRVVVIGGGFGGLRTVLALRRAPVEVVLVDRRNFHLFQPLTYQVATGGLSPAQIAYPLRAVFQRARNVRVLLAEAVDVDVRAHRVLLRPVDGVAAPESIGYDSLVVAAGSHYSWFGHDDWRRYSHEVKSLESALAVRSQILRAFEAADAETDPYRRDAWLTFAVVGGGPTGVEMAGQIGELARDTLRRDFRRIDTRRCRILLIEAADRVLTSFPSGLSGKAAESLRRLGVTPLVNTLVVDVDAGGVTVEHGGGRERVAARTVVWAAGVSASGLAARLADGTGADRDAAGRITVGPDLTVPGHPEVFAIGDLVRVRDAGGEILALPGVAPVAMQQGRYVAKLIAARARGRTVGPFRYRDKGNLATIGRAAAVADIKGARLSGLVAWLIWLFVHLWYLVGFQNRVLVFIQWLAGFVTRGHQARLITEPAASAVRGDRVAGPRRKPAR